MQFSNHAAKTLQSLPSAAPNNKETKKRKKIKASNFPSNLSRERVRESL